MSFNSGKGGGADRIAHTHSRLRGPLPVRLAVLVNDEAVGILLLDLMGVVESAMIFVQRQHVRKEERCIRRIPGVKCPEPATEYSPSRQQSLPARPIELGAMNECLELGIEGFWEHPVEQLQPALTIEGILTPTPVDDFLDLLSLLRVEPGPADGGDLPDQPQEFLNLSDPPSCDGTGLQPQHCEHSVQRPIHRVGAVGKGSQGCHNFLEM